MYSYDDGNGRIRRTVGDIALARFVMPEPSASTARLPIQRDRKQRCDKQEATQRGTQDATRAWAGF